jgi:CRISPR-associated protein Cas2
MSRRRFLVTYDISDEDRLRRVFKTMNGFGDGIQHSVFVCELNPRERVQMEAKLRATVHHTDDQILIMDLGQADREMGDFIVSIGRDFSLPARTLVV